MRPLSIMAGVASGFAAMLSMAYALKSPRVLLGWVTQSNSSTLIDQPEIFIRVWRSGSKSMYLPVVMPPSTAILPHAMHSICAG